MERIDTNPSLDQFFGELLSEALRSERVEIADGSRHYLVQLFGDFSRVEGLYAAARRGEGGTPTLAWLYERAQSGDPGSRFDAWRHLGDVALMVSSLFGAYLERRRAVVGVEYYVRMGRGAYGTAATYARRSGFAPVFEELAQKFRDLVDVLTRVGEATTLPVAGGLERLYERWLARPGNDDIHERLTRLGASPVLVGIGSA